MKVNVIGNKVRLVSTIREDINNIIEFEKDNNLFVHRYNKEKHIQLLSDNNCFHLSIKRLDNNNLIGHMILFGGESRDKILEFRRLTIDEKGQGIGKEAVKLLKILCFEEFKYHRLWLDVFSDNKRAIHVYESEGFILECELRDKFKTENGYRSQRIYSILEDEYYLINKKQLGDK